MIKLKWKDIGLGASLVLAGACNSGPSLEAPSAVQAITNRPAEALKASVQVLLLKSPSLLEVQSGSDIQVTEEQRKKILDEQAAIEIKLKAISPEIKVLYRYRFVLNGLAVVIPADVLDQVRELDDIVYTSTDSPFARPKASFSRVLEETEDSATSVWGSITSVDFIGATEAYDAYALTDDSGEKTPLLGQGIKVGVLDTGIDYTHKMFGGLGTEEAFKANDPNLLEEGSFPANKVMGGIDLVGTAYSANAKSYKDRIPLPDSDPLDEGSHGSHVAGTISGIGNGIQTYSGVAPEADLYAIKVFGKEGSTADSVVIAGLEYAMDPNQDLDPSDKLDVVNLSLGGPFGLAHTLYEKAVTNLTEKGGVVAVMSAGNSGDVPHIVGSPSVSDHAISVASSIDGMDQNWKFAAVSFEADGAEPIVVQAIESTMTKPVGEEDIVGNLVFIGLADEELNEEAKTALSAGGVALIDRGKITFAEKLKRAFEAGASAAIVANNVDGEPIAMGGDGEFAKPGIMINKALGDILKEQLEKGLNPKVDFQIEQKFEIPERIDSISGFSSRGPRSIDSAFKPEISAPGTLIVSAEAGSGDKASLKSGTSMAAPHMAGVMALLKQAKPELSSKVLKAIALASAKNMQDREGTSYPFARQGMGRVQVLEALAIPAVAVPSNLSLGLESVSGKKLVERKVKLVNLKSEAVSIYLEPVRVSAGLEVTFTQTHVDLEPRAYKEVGVRFSYLIDHLESSRMEVEAEISLDTLLKDGTSAGPKSFIKALGSLGKLTKVEKPSLKVYAQSAEEAEGALAELELNNRGVDSTMVYPFELLAKDDQKPSKPNGLSRLADVCDIEAFGYRTITKEIEGVHETLLQFGVKLFHPLTSWHHCELSIQVDRDGDGIADQEIIGGDLSGLAPSAPTGTFATAVFDASKMRDLRKQYETTDQEEEDYSAAIQATGAFQGLNHSSVAIMEIAAKELNFAPNQMLRVKVASLVTETALVANDDYLGLQEYVDLDPSYSKASFLGLPESVELAAGEAKTISITKGIGNKKMLILVPGNRPRKSYADKGSQGFVVKPSFGF